MLRFWALESKELYKALVLGPLGFGICPAGNGKEGKESLCGLRGHSTCGLPLRRGAEVLLNPFSASHTGLSRGLSEDEPILITGVYITTS